MKEEKPTAITKPTETKPVVHKPLATKPTAQKPLATKPAESKDILKKPTINLKVFNKWDTTGIAIADQGLKKYINLKPILVPKTHGRSIKIRFHRSKKPIVERLIGKVMVPGHTKKHKHKRTSGHITGKGIHAYKIVQKCFEIIEEKTKKNPIEVFVKAIENAAPREEVTTIEYGGARYAQAVDCAPQRRIDLALRMFVWGAYSQSFNKKRSIQDALADEILKAYTLDQKSFALSKKLESERQADSSR